MKKAKKREKKAGKKEKASKRERSRSNNSTNSSKKDSNRHGYGEKRSFNEYNQNNDELKVSKKERHDDYNNRHNEERLDSDRNTKRKYGLITNDKSYQSDKINKDDMELGPNAAILTKKLEQKRLEDEAKYRPRGSVKHLSEEDRLKRMKEMEDDARIYNQIKSQNTRRSNNDRDEDYERSDRKSGDAKFLNEMRKDVYNNNEISMEDRLQRNKHYHQRGNDLDSSGFLKR
jgi:hypothetical protein